MVGVVEPNASKSNDKPKPIKIEDYFMNPLQIRVPAKGKYSPKTDERCLTWCSQSVRGRYEGQEPWCRSLCIRRVFEHEVERLTSHFSRDSAFQLHAAAARERVFRGQEAGSESESDSSSYFANNNNQDGSSSSSTLSSTTHPTPSRYPLPPEGQPPSALSGSGNTTTVGGPRTHGVRYWEAGWYVWMTKNAWAVQERVEMMGLDLEKQTRWMRVKEGERREWGGAEGEREEGEGQGEQGGFGGAQMGGHAGYGGGGQQEEGYEFGMDGEQDKIHPYLIASEESFLLRIPTRLPPINSYTSRLLAPTWKVLSITRESVESGRQRDLAMHAWELVKEGAPVRLVKNVFKTCFSSFGKKED